MRDTWHPLPLLLADSPFDAYYYDQVTGEQKNLTQAGECRPDRLPACTSGSVCVHAQGVLPVLLHLSRTVPDPLLAPRNGQGAAPLPC